MFPSGIFNRKNGRIPCQVCVLRARSLATRLSENGLAWKKPVTPCAHVDNPSICLPGGGVKRLLGVYSHCHEKVRSASDRDMDSPTRSCGCPLGLIGSSLDISSGTAEHQGLSVPPEASQDQCEHARSGVPLRKRARESGTVEPDADLRYPLAYQHVSELLAERGVAVDPTCTGAGCRPMHPNWTNAVGHI